MEGRSFRPGWRMAAGVALAGAVAGLATRVIEQKGHKVDPCVEEVHKLQIPDAVGRESALERGFMDAELIVCHARRRMEVECFSEAYSMSDVPPIFTPRNEMQADLSSPDQIAAVQDVIILDEMQSCAREVIAALNQHGPDHADLQLDHTVPFIPGQGHRHLAHIRAHVEAHSSHDL